MKKKIILFSSIGAAVLVAAIVLIICLCLPKGSKSYRTINVFNVEGTAKVKRGSSQLEAKKDMKLKNEDIVYVDHASTLTLKLDSDKFIMAKEDTTLKLVATGKKNNTKTRLEVINGGVIVEVKEKLKDSEAFEIASSNSIMAIRGTQISFNVVTLDNKITTTMAVLKGTTEVMLYKDETLNAITLSNMLKISYTTGTDKVSNDIYNLLDTKDKKDITDSDLETIFNTSKEELTSAEIDEIVNAINTFERSDNELVNGVIKLNMANTPEYSKDPKNYITTDKEYSNLTYLYSKTIDGTYTEFDSNSPLEMGEWYCKVISTIAYRSDPIKFSVGPIRISEAFDLKYEKLNGAAYFMGTINELEEFFKSDIAKTPNDDPTQYPYQQYKYYIKVNFYTEGYGYDLVLDCENFQKVCNGAIGGVGKVDVNIEYSLPEYFEIISSDDYEYTLDAYMKINDVYVAPYEGGDAEIIASVEVYENDVDIFKLMYDAGDGEVELVPELEDGIVEALIPKDQFSFYFMLEGTNYKSETYYYDRNNFVDASSATMSGGTPKNAIVTYNEDSTINFYYDINFDGNDEFEYLAHLKYTDSTINTSRPLILSGTNKYVVVEDTPNTTYSFVKMGIAKEVNGLKYICGSVDNPSGAINEAPQFGGISYGDNGYYVYGYEFFISGNDIDLRDASGTYLSTVTESDFTPDDESNTFVEVLGYDTIYEVYGSGIIYGFINAEVAGPDATTHGAFTNDVKQYVTQVLANYGITLKGSNTYYNDHIYFQLG